MRVVEIEFDMNVGAGPMGPGSKFTRWFRATDGHVMDWLPDEQVLVIDGYRYSPRGARWRCELPKVPDPPNGLPCVCGEPSAPGEHRPDGPCLAPVKEPDGTDQPGAAAGPARGKKRRK